MHTVIKIGQTDRQTGRQAGRRKIKDAFIYCQVYSLSDRGVGVLEWAPTPKLFRVVEYPGELKVNLWEYIGIIVPGFPVTL